MIHLYTGDGKGKTTAALGLLVRAAGHGRSILLAQFHKGSFSGELVTLEKIPKVTIFRSEENYGFYKRASEEVKQLIQQQNNNILNKTIQLLETGGIDMLILDEVCAAYNYESVDIKKLHTLIDNLDSKLELVLTGRNAAQYFYDIADYVTNFEKIKHPFDKNISARVGVEY